MVEVSINETIAQYSWSPCTWNHVKLHKEFNSWKIQINKKENILPLMDLKTLTWGEGTYIPLFSYFFVKNITNWAFFSFAGFNGCFKKLRINGRDAIHFIDRFSGSAKFGSCPRH